MAHDHHHAPDTRDRRLALAIGVNVALTLAQIVGGLLSGSLALIADAVHNLSDAVSLALAWGARRIARRPADSTMTFGYGRAEVVAALINYTTLILIGVYLVYEAILRFFQPQDVDGWLVVVIAVFALAVDAVTALLTWTMSKSSVNIRAAFLHNLADALGSVAVIVAGTLILLYDWRLADPVATLIIAGYILWLSFGEIGRVIRILMLGAPPGTDVAAIVADLRAADGVAGVHHVHLWQMQEHATALDAHIALDPGRWQDADEIKSALKRLLTDRHGIAHSTLELECARHVCDAPQVIGHG